MAAGGIAVSPARRWIISIKSVAWVVRLIAPLDNLLWDRAMILQLFGFDYTWEVYVPAAERKYSYYVIPVLGGDRFIARFEPQLAKTQIQISNWWWEKDFTVTDEWRSQIRRALERLAACFHKSEGVQFLTNI